MSPRSIRFESSTSSAAVSSGWRPISRRKSWRRLDHLDAAFLELAVEALDVRGLDLQGIEGLG
jgi:hypothetical protein